jgi:predicted acylesterase/phospholipase RssA
MGTGFIPREYLRAGRIGLVLCGGGFKGAYQIGAWKALRELGVTRLSAIAGTSVGALNAVLIANGDSAAAEEVWVKTAFMRWFPRSVKKYLLAYALLLGPFALSLIFCASLAVPVEVALWRALADRRWNGHFAPHQLSRPEILLWDVMIFCWIAACLVGACVSLRLMPRRLFVFLPSGLFALFSAILAPLAFCTIRELLYYYSWRVGLIAVASALVASVFGLCCYIIGADCLHSAYRNATLFSNAEILSSVDADLNVEQMRSSLQSLFVTVAHGETFFDPLTNDWRLVRRQIPGQGTVLVREDDPDTPGTRTAWVAHYEDLCEVARSKEAMIEVLRLTSALPFIFTMGVSPEDEILVDGGFADNMPIIPLLEKQLDYVIIIALDPRVPKTRAKLQEYIDDAWDRCWPAWAGRERVDEIFESRMKGGDYRSLLPPRPYLKPGRVIMIIPQGFLATWNLPVLRFLSGTLNFGFKARLRWLQMGYEETKNQKNMHALV